MLPIIIAAALWGGCWQGDKVLFRCDNMAVVTALKRKKRKFNCRDRQMMHLLCCLRFFEANYSFNLIPEHIGGIDNDLADDLSRGNLSAFLQKSNLPSTAVSAIPSELLEMLMGPGQIGRHNIGCSTLF